jgi:hypothetical protein
MTIETPPSGTWWPAKTSGMSFNFTTLGIVGLAGLVGSLALMHAAPHLGLESVGVAFDRYGYYIVTGWGLLVAWDMWPRGVQVGIEAGELVIKRHRRTQRIPLSGARIRFGKYVVQNQPLGTIMFVSGSQGGKTNIAGMGVTLPDGKYQEKPGYNLNLTMDAGPFEELRQAVSQATP